VYERQRVPSVLAITQRSLRRAVLLPAHLAYVLPATRSLGDWCELCMGIVANRKPNGLTYRAVCVAQGLASAFASCAAASRGSGS